MQTSNSSFLKERLRIGGYKERTISRVRDKVVRMYLKGMGTYMISDNLQLQGTYVSPDTVRRILKKHGVRLRPPNNLNKVPPHLKQLAIEIAEQQSPEEALEYLRVQHHQIHLDTVKRWLREKNRGYRPLPPRVEEDVKEAVRIYNEDKIGAYKIARKLKHQGIHIKPRTLLRYLKRYIDIRTNKETLHLATKHKTKPFSGDKREKYYLMGFRAGDLHVQPVSDFRILVSCTSSVPAFGRLFRRAFKEHGHIDEHPCANITKEGYRCWQRTFRVHLERPSFDFMVTKKIIEPDAPDDNFYSFVSGFGDAEMCISISRSGRKQARYVTVTVDFGNKDQQLLENLRSGLLKRGIHANIRKATTPRGEPYHRVYVKRKDDVLTLLRKLQLKHEDKKGMKQLAVHVLEKRLQWRETKPLVKSARQAKERRRQRFWREIRRELVSRQRQREIFHESKSPSSSRLTKQPSLITTNNLMTSSEKVC